MPSSESGDRRLLRYALQGAARELLPGERVHVCLRRIVPGADGVRVVYSPSSGRASYRNLMVCGSVWTCPVCSAKIATSKAEEIERAIRVHQAGGGRVLLLTLTARHHRQDALRPLLDGFLKAVGDLKRHRAYRTPMQAAGFLGEIRAPEVTHGVHGWHPHLHSLVFVSASVDRTALETALFPVWLKRLEKHGLDAVEGVGLEFREVGTRAGEDDAKVATYVTGAAHDLGTAPPRWTAADELARGHEKHGRRGGRSPFALLADYGRGDARAGHLFREYAAAFKGRHQIRWSRGLRALLLGDEAQPTDEELAAATEADARTAGNVDRIGWRTVVQAGPTARARLLEVVESVRGEDWTVVEAFIRSLLPIRNRSG